MTTTTTAPISNLDVLDTRPAYVVTTAAYQVGTYDPDKIHMDFGQVVTTVTRGQVAQHRLHLEPDHRAAERIAAGRHESALAATGYSRATTGRPVIVRTVTCRPAGASEGVHGEVYHAPDCGGGCDGCGYIAGDGSWYPGPCPAEDAPHQDERSA